MPVLQSLLMVLRMLLILPSTHSLSTFRWSPANLSFYDDLRSDEDSPPNTEIRYGSNVIGVRYANDTTGELSSRLCHITSILPLSDKEGKPRADTFGLFSEAASMLAMLHFNHKIDSIVPDLKTNPKLQSCNLKFTMDFQDSRGSPIAANRVLIEDVLTRRHSLSNPSPCALLGASRSAVTGPLSLMASVYGVPVVSSQSTSSQLDNKSIFRLFGRTCPTDAGVARAAVRYLQDVLGVTHCGVLFVRDEFGSAFHEEFTREAFAGDQAMQVVSASFDTANSHESIKDAIAVLAKTGYNYFFCITLSRYYDEVMGAAFDAGIAGVGRFWLFGSGASRVLGTNYKYDAATQRDLASATSGIATIILDIRNDAFDKEWLAMIRDPVFKQYFVSKQPSGIDFSNFTFYSQPNEWEYLHYDAFMAIGFAMCEAKQDFFTGPAFYSALMRTSFDGASGQVHFEGKTGTRDARKLRYKVVNLIANEPNSRGEITFRSVQVAHHVMTRAHNESFMKWEAMNRTTFGGNSKRAPPVLPPLNHNHNMIGTGARATGLILAALAMFVSVAWFSWTLKYRKTHVVACSQPQFLFLLCVGTLVMASSIIPLSLQEPISQEGLNTACMAAPWLLQVGFVVSFSAVFSKTSLMNKLNDHTRRFRRIRVSTTKVMLPFLVFLSGSMVLLLSWNVVAPLRWRREYRTSFDIYGRYTESFGHCTTDCLSFAVTLIGLDAGLLLFVVAENYRARNNATEYSESYYIAISMVSVLQALLLGIPVLLVVRENRSADFLIRSLIVTIICGSILLPLFIPKERARSRYTKALEEEQPRSMERSDQTVEEKWMALKKGFDGSDSSGSSVNGVRRVVDSSIIYQASLPAIDEEYSSGDNSSKAWIPNLGDLCL